MAMLEDYDANVVDLVPCLVKDALNDLSNTTIELATEKEMKEAKEYVLKRRSVTLLLIGTDCARYGIMKNYSNKTWKWVQTITQSQLMKL